MEDENKIENYNEETEYLTKTISKLENQAEVNFAFTFVGVILIVIGLFTFINDISLIAGGLSIIGIGIGVCVYNIYVRNSKRKRARELKQDLDKTKQYKKDHPTDSY